MGFLDLPPPPPLICSFCGKDDTQVFAMIEGPKVCICNVCVSLANECLAARMDDAFKATGPAPDRLRRGNGLYGFASAANCPTTINPPTVDTNTEGE